MRPTQILRGGGDSPLGKYNKWIGSWGKLGVVKQHRIITYGVSPNRLNPLAGTGHDAIFNTWRRFSKQVFYIAPPIFAAYYILDWATERNHFLNSKEGRALYGGEEE